MSRPPHPNARMQDPAAGVPHQLLPHMHLVSSYRYPAMTTFSHETAVEYLLSATKVVRDLQPMHWMMLDGPPDNTVVLTWQPLNHLGTNFASDGYVWADVEQAYKVEILEIYIHRSGFHPPNETVATHSRRRFRLAGVANPNTNLPPCDPSLWIVYYGKAAPGDQIPANRIQVTPQTQNIVAQRRYLQSHGPLSRKEFMLHDRNNWPTISIPSQPGQQGYSQGHPYAQQVINRQQAQLFQPAQPTGYTAAQAKAAAARGHRAPVPGMAPAPDLSLDEEEVSSGDILDTLTPRDISKMRYRNHHEWMEEIFASPYRIDQIIPVDLGLGRKGELEPLTKNFFYAPGGVTTSRKDSREGDEGPPAAVGKMDPEKSADFSKAVAQKLADMTAEMQNMRKVHARKLQKVNKLSMLRDAERKLRDAFVDPSDVGNDIWRVEGHMELNKEEGAPPVDFNERVPRTKVDDILSGIASTWSEPVRSSGDVKCVQKGGLQERPKEPIEPVVALDADVSMGGHSHGFDQLDGTMGGGSSGAIPQTGAPTMPPQQGISQPTVTVPNALPVATSSSQPAIPPNPSTNDDVVMGGVEDKQSHLTAAEQPGSADKDGDWVLVNKDGPESPLKNANSPTTNQTEPQQASHGATSENTTMTSQATAVSLGGGAALPVPSLTPIPTAAATPSGDISTPGTGGDFEAAHMNTAGEALADYPQDNDEIDMGALDNSAFVDAFHEPDGNDEQHNPENDEIA
ncbi:hypothetical protein FQN57_006189 [Myotisia sp. PD_48]|nr:hypothetical protein FQN57_006189 [Myotisia sp. PD_48]